MPACHRERMQAMVASTQATPPRWEDVRLFLATYRARTLAGAALRMDVDASTVSRRLAALEETLGARLFDRTRDGLVPTQSAEALLGGAEEMEAGLSRLLREASALESSVEGVVRLSVTPGLADVFLAPALVRLRARHPALRIEIDASQRLVDLGRREADLAIRTIKPTGGDLVFVRVLSDRWWPMASAAYAEELGRVDDLDALAEARWIAWGEDLAAIPVAAWLRRHLPKVLPVLRTSHLASQLAAVESGLGVALLPESYADVRPVVRVAFRKALAEAVGPLPEDALWLVTHRALRGVPRVDAVWRFVVEELAGATTGGRRKARPPR